MTADSFVLAVQYVLAALQRRLRARHMVRDYIERLSHRRLRSLSSLTSGKMLSATSPEALPRKLLPISHRSSFVEANTEELRFPPSPLAPAMLRQVKAGRTG